MCPRGRTGELVLAVEDPLVFVPAFRIYCPHMANVDSHAAGDFCWFSTWHDRPSRCEEVLWIGAWLDGGRFADGPK